jgi:antitoxin (DNA-binding transcriptional repressor) of toxin-antitoxin stability system
VNGGAKVACKSRDYKGEAGEIVIITRHGRPVARIVAKPEVRRARIRATLERMLADRSRRPKLTVDEILEMRDEGRRF